MPTPTERMVFELEAACPAWQVWMVPAYPGPNIWCARLWADVDAVPPRVLNAHSPDELAEYIRDAENVAEGMETATESAHLTYE